MADQNDHVREPFRSILASIVKPHPQPEPKPAPKILTNRDRYRALEGVYCELVAAGVVIDIAQLDWAVREVESRLRESELDNQYRYELARRAAGIMPRLHDSDSEPWK